MIISLANIFLIYFIPATFFPTTVDSVMAIQGEWRLQQASIGITAMHLQLLHNNKIVIYDRTDFGASNISLPGNRCRFDPQEKVLKTDCSAHSVLYDPVTNEFRPLTVRTDIWCSSGAVLADGTLVQTGGYNDGDEVIRIISPGDAGNDFCDWVEFPGFLSKRRWYATNQILPDGRVIIIGGRDQFSYEFFLPESILLGKNSEVPSLFDFPFLKETKYRNHEENNLYPFVHLLPDGNLFIFANRRSIVLDYKNNSVVREFQSINGEPRNYPSSGSSVLLPIDENSPVLETEIMVCGGSTSPNAFHAAQRGMFLRASSTCGRLNVSDNDAEVRWRMHEMPMPRVMGDMLILPTGDILIINGASSGSAGWERARDPVTRPLIYQTQRIPDENDGNRFSVMEASPRPRLYHSTALLLIDGRVLVGGSNPHIGYNFSGVEFPTDLSLETFHPPYLATQYDPLRPRIIQVMNNLSYKKPFSLVFFVTNLLKSSGVISIRIIAPPFNTHGFSMNQRMVVLKRGDVSFVSYNTYNISVVGPSTPEIAPPGHYMMFLVHANIPSSGVWVLIQ
ncbi:hypothetical protein Leryth_002068 [Lithospermum erythrorhizon]|uniref:Galactose oxidase n=1 Tax=Lithospermum erythrorhizon TaxID=34254 RepID=A0AAV3RFF8_LITER|nr:hypothetical protein Leryth_002068 [Lithospermum erythrorhizon]